MNGWVKASWTTSDSGRQVRAYRLTAAGQKQLDKALSHYQRTSLAIGVILDNA